MRTLVLCITTALVLVGGIAAAGSARDLLDAARLRPGDLKPECEPGGTGAASPDAARVYEQPPEPPAARASHRYRCGDAEGVVSLLAYANAALAQAQLPHIAEQLWGDDRSPPGHLDLLLRRGSVLAITSGAAASRLADKLHRRAFLHYGGGIDVERRGFEPYAGQLITGIFGTLAGSGGGASVRLSGSEAAPDIGRAFTAALRCDEISTVAWRGFCAVAALGSGGFQTPEAPRALVGLSLAIPSGLSLERALRLDQGRLSLSVMLLAPGHPARVQLQDLRANGDAQEVALVMNRLTTLPAAAPGLVLPAGLRGVVGGLGARVAQRGWPLQVQGGVGRFKSPVPAELHAVVLPDGGRFLVVIERPTDGLFISAYPQVPLRGEDAAR